MKNFQVFLREGMRTVTIHYDGTVEYYPSDKNQEAMAKTADEIVKILMRQLTQ